MKCYSFLSWSTVADLLVTFLGALFAFLLALSYDRSQKKTIKGRETEKFENLLLLRLNYFSILIEGSIIYCEKQISYFKKFADNLKGSPFEIHNPEVIGSFDLIRTKEQTSKDLFEAYIHFNEDKKNAVKEFKKIYSTIDFLILKFQSLIDQNERHIPFKHSDQILFSKSFEKFGRVIKAKLEEPNMKSHNTQYNFLNSYYLLYIELVKDEFSIIRVKEEFLIPFLKDYKVIINDQNFNFMVDILIGKCLSKARQIEINSNRFATDFENIETELKTEIGFLKEILGRINQLLQNHEKLNSLKTMKNEN